MRGRDVVKTQHKLGHFLFLLLSNRHSSLIAAVTTRVTVISLTRKLSTAQVYRIHHYRYNALRMFISCFYCFLTDILHWSLLSLRVSQSHHLLESWILLRYTECINMSTTHCVCSFSFCILLLLFNSFLYYLHLISI